MNFSIISCFFSNLIDFKLIFFLIFVNINRYEKCLYRLTHTHTHTPTHKLTFTLTHKLLLYKYLNVVL